MRKRKRQKNAITSADTFMHDAFGSVRTIMIDYEPWFVGKDVADALGYARPAKAIQDHVNEKDKLFISSQCQSRFRTDIVKDFNFKDLGQRGGYLINESGLYDLVFDSTLPQAKKFRRWVTAEVLPTLRKTGQYTMTEWNKARNEGIEVRGLLTSTIDDSGENERMHGHAYSNYINLIYMTLFNASAKELKEQRGISSSGDLRAALTPSELKSVKRAEAYISTMIIIGASYAELKEGLSKNAIKLLVND